MVKAFLGKAGLHLLALVCLINMTQAHVDESRPNLSCFKLRHVNTNELTRQRGEEKITNFASGAELLRESMLVNAGYVKCPAYAHLFKLIEDQQPMNQKLIQSLALVVTYDRVFYYSLFQKSLPKSANHFIEAIKEFETNKHKSTSSKDTWLDLINCLSSFVANQPEVAGFLNEPSRAESIKSTASFMAIPIDNEQTPAGLVPNLIRKFEGQQIEISQDVYESARSSILAIEGASVAQERIEFEAAQNNAARPADGNEKSPVTIDLAELVAQEPAGQSAQVVPIESPEKTKVTNADAHLEPVELIVDDSQTAAEDNLNKFNLNQLAILKFIKMRLESKQSSPKLNIRLAYDFQNHFGHLLKFNSNSPDEVTQAALKFKADSSNEKLFEKVRKVTDLYEEIINVLAEIQTLGNKYNHLNEFALPLKKLNSLLGKMDARFDLDYIRRLERIWQAKLVEYSTLQNFIDS